MPDMDELLQANLEAIEKGAPIEDILNRLPKEAEELTSLISLAHAVRVLPHPELSPAQSHAGQQKVLAAAHANSQPTPGNEPVTQPQPAPKPQPDAQPQVGPQPGPTERRNTRWIWPRWVNGQKWALPVMAGLAAVLITCVAMAAGVGAWMDGPSAAKAATLMDVNGYVEVQDLSGGWNVAAEGQKLRAGESIRTSSASGATLLFYEGSRTTLGSNTDVVIKTVGGAWGSGLQVDLVQVTGKTSHSVVPLRGKNSAYKVDAPGGTASVHGTRFSVAVGSSGQSLFAVNTGKVEVTNPKSRVFVTSGQATKVDPGQVAESPAYQFTLDGTFSSSNGNIWTVASTPFLVTGASLSGSPVVGDDVHIEGRILQTGEWVADTVQRMDISEPSASFSGPVEAMPDGGPWQVGGVSLTVDDQTQIDPAVKLGDAVQVMYRVINGQWKALSITSLAGSAVEPAHTPTPIPGAKPALEFSPEETQLSSCEANYSFTGGLVNAGEQQDDVASNVELGYTIDMGAEFVQSVELSPDSWETIDQGKTMPFTVSLELNRQTWDQATAKKVVKLRVFVAHETNRPDHLQPKMTITIDGGECKPTDTPTVEPSDTPTVEPSETPTGEVSETSTPETLDDVCTGANPQPTGMELAARYGVDYGVIMGYFCNDHLGFGEIDTGYNLSLETNTPVEQIFAMRLSGMGWGQIKQELLEKNNPKPTEEQPKEKPTKKAKSSKP